MVDCEVVTLSELVCELARLVLAEIVDDTQDEGDGDKVVETRAVRLAVAAGDNVVEMTVERLAVAKELAVREMLADGETEGDAVPSCADIEELGDSDGVNDDEKDTAIDRLLNGETEKDGDCVGDIEKRNDDDIRAELEGEMLAVSLTEDEGDMETAADSVANALAENEPVTELDTLGECVEEREGAGVRDTEAVILTERLTLEVMLGLGENDIVWKIVLVALATVRVTMGEFDEVAVSQREKPNDRVTDAVVVVVVEMYGLALMLLETVLVCDTMRDSEIEEVAAHDEIGVADTVFVELRTIVGYGVDDGNRVADAADD